MYDENVSKKSAGSECFTEIKKNLRSSGLLRSVRYLDTDVSGQPMGVIFKSQVVQD
jgi:hypothetical protein